MSDNLTSRNLTKPLVAVFLDSCVNNNLTPDCRTKTCGVLSRAIRTRRVTFGMSVRDTSLAIGSSAPTANAWMWRNLPNDYLTMIQVVEDDATTADTRWVVTAPLEEIDDVEVWGFLVNPISDLYHWADKPKRPGSLPRLLPSHPGWADKGHNKWAVWVLLVLSGGQTKPAIQTATGICSTSLKESLKWLEENGLIESVAKKGRSKLWTPLEPAWAPCDDTGSAVIAARKELYALERKTYNQRMEVRLQP